MKVPWVTLTLVTLYPAIVLGGWFILVWAVIAVLGLIRLRQEGLL